MCFGGLQVAVHKNYHHELATLELDPTVTLENEIEMPVGYVRGRDLKINLHIDGILFEANSIYTSGTNLNSMVLESVDEFVSKLVANILSQRGADVVKLLMDRHPPEKNRPVTLKEHEGKMMKHKAKVDKLREQFAEPQKE